MSHLRLGNLLYYKTYYGLSQKKQLATSISLADFSVFKFVCLQINKRLGFMDDRHAGDFRCPNCTELRCRGVGIVREHSLKRCTLKIRLTKF